MENIDPGSMVHPASAIGRGSRASRTELNHELATLLRSSRQQLHNVQHGLNRVMTFEPLTSVKDLIIVGDGPAADEIFQYCEDQTVRGYRFRGVFHERPITGPLASRQLGGIEAAKAFAVQNRIDILYCALPGAYREEITELMEFCERNTIRFRVIPSVDSFIPVVKTTDLTFHGAVPVSRLRNEPLDRKGNRLLKRGFDIVFSFLVIALIFSWLFPILAILVKLSSKGPVFFKQTRLGERKKKFSCYKFRSMQMNEEADSKQATRNDPRITKVGAFLRKSNLDEMPQFFNVLLGQMSVVGPRPHPLKLNDQFRDIIDKYMVRHFVRPGITGWAQVNGFRGETRTPELMEKRVDLDVWYLENWSFLMDLKIVVKTVTNMFGKDDMAF
ncbi:MAG: exopolysaccharide biosynthesis polyprenyl glycosylphosphotransferase [Flavobacteriales bacterium]|jgi:Undecaprenyl-phosphate glucose phosphotransferase|nr:exopolysaccharide biosynthesis polyprenyl glycosylphosphotransferase [Flavobacteriales bacterium]MBK6892650.1 exopolysaccharide biosynthesis polyprenyl glycosylphosphotransferase [Flavobacteriales bacterium]MBK7246791.1 exopolysaccharide biosynthesis polyprenyl glycosylphosphotransferase [Flavobacteriales bacterium]MBK9061091.1 exopolysaccharide biosynthesis polyprenyl glycosylphosphotransferase [Flavobacteriales bacterium]MBK9599179.1 exopolysaccharide biosynthesis polyprenyl glycosylphosph